MPRRPLRKKPCRVRYEQAHPTVSFRIQKAAYDRLKRAMGMLGQSFGEWVRDHLDRDDRRAEAAALKLAQERDGLRQQLQAIARRIAESEKELAELDRKKEARRQEILAPVEPERDRIIQEAKKRAEAMVEDQEFWLAFGEDKVAEVKGRVRQAESQLREVNRHVEEGRSELAQIERRKEALLSSLSEKATEMARRQGLPSTSCIDCAALRMIAPIVAAGSRIVESMHANASPEVRPQAPPHDQPQVGAQDSQAAPGSKPAGGQHPH